jgi:aspartate aminotransferase
VTGIATPTSLMQRAAPRLLALRHDYAWIARWRQRFVEELSSLGYDVVRPDATLFVYARTPDGVEDFEFTAALAAQGMLVLPAPVFHHEGYFRLSLTGSERMLEQALPILEQAVA